VKKRRFLAPLAVSVASLLGGATVSAQASATPEVTSEASAPTTPDQLVLKRSTYRELRLADDDSYDSHVSHESHASHESHESHVSSS
jgi:hypothetical protein